jgi:uncharacterized protein
MLSRSAPEFIAYRQTMLDRDAVQKAAVAHRVEEAWIVASQAAEFLKTAYALHQVWLFGSLAEGRRFSMTSDIDLAILQLPTDDYLRAIALMQDISPNFKVDLVQIERLPSTFKTEILKKGKLL